MLKVSYISSPMMLLYPTFQIYEDWKLKEGWKQGSEFRKWKWKPGEILKLSSELPPTPLSSCLGWTSFDKNPLILDNLNFVFLVFNKKYSSF